MAALTRKVAGIVAGQEQTVRKRRPPPIDIGLRKAIRSSGMTHYGLAKVAGITPQQIDRFMLDPEDPRHRDMTLSTAAKVAAVLRLELVEVM
jgi:hypothetical protein